MRIWIINLLEKEFGFSDVLSNYSRTYSWMANQLGHMTLGLATTFLLIWLTQTVSIVPELQAQDWVLAVVTIIAVGGILRYELYTPARVAIGCVIFVVGIIVFMSTEIVEPALLLGIFDVLIAVVTLAIGGGIALLLYWCGKKLVRSLQKIRERPMPVAWPTKDGIVKMAFYDIYERENPLTSIRDLSTSLGYWVVGAVIAVVAVALGIMHTIELWPSEAAKGGAVAGAEGEDALRLVSVLCVMTLANLIVLCLAEDGRFGLLGVQAVVAGGFVATDGFYLRTSNEGLHESLLAIAAALFTGTVIFALFGGGARQRQDENWLWSGRSFLSLTAAFLSMMFYTAFHDTIDPNWGGPIGAAIAAVAIWWTKEFGSDLPNVRNDIVTAQALRRRQGGSSTDPTIRDREAEYVDDATQDVRTDSAFYLAGAYIAVGVLVEAPSVGAGSEQASQGWLSDVEIIGLLLFVLVFLALGRNWAYRQNAIDMLGAGRANRLALVTRPIMTLSGVPVTHGDLHDLATGNLVGFSQHRIVFGEPGTGVSSLGAAIATEAALHGIPSDLLKAPKPPDDRRTARVVTMTLLSNSHDGVRLAADLLYRPVRDFWFVENPDKNTPVLKREVSPLERPGAKKADFPHASLVVIDDCENAPNQMKSTLDRLSLTDGQDTIWLVNKPSSDPHAQALRTLIETGIAARAPNSTINCYEIT